MNSPRFIASAVIAVISFAPLRAQQPASTIRGHVVDAATGRPLAGVVVAVGRRGAPTGTDGGYLLAGLPAGRGALRATRPGYAPASRAVTVAGGDTLVVDLALAPRAGGRSGTVPVGYGEQRPDDITGAVAQLTAEAFNPGRIVSPGELLTGRLAGVQVVQNNEPGGAIAIRIRGAASPNASDDPLYVLDGMPLGTGTGGGLSVGRDPLDFLDPADVESITILKDASAAAIYGMNAAHGVVLIRTKSGSGAGRPGAHLDYSGSYSTSSVTRLPSVLNAAQFAAAVATYAPARVPLLGSANTDWFGRIGRTAFGQAQDLSLSGTGERASYRLSMGYLRQDGVIQGTTAERLSLGVNADQRLFGDDLELQVHVRGSRLTDRFTPADVLGDAAAMAPTQPVYDPASITGYWDWPTSSASPSNPVASLNLATDHATTRRSLGNVQAGYRLPFLRALRATVSVGYDVAFADRSIFVPNDLAAQVRQGHGYLALAHDTQTHQVLGAYLEYAAPLRFVKGSIAVTGGYSHARSHADYSLIQETGLHSNLTGDASVPPPDNVLLSKAIVDDTLVSFFGRLHYDLAGRYLATVSLRRDRSSRFGPGDRWGTFPSVGVAWRLSQEPFFRRATALSDLKLRAAWARTGDQTFGGLAPFATYAPLAPTTPYQFGNPFLGTSPPAPVDADIRWETTASVNLGVDLGLWGDRLRGSIDWYTATTSDLIFTLPTAAGSVFSNDVTTNVGSMKNSGLEFSLEARLIRGSGRDLDWTATFTATHNTNRLTSIEPSQQVTAILTGGISGGVGQKIEVLEPGQPINSFFVYQQKYANGKPVYSANPLDMYVDRNNDGIINDLDRRAYHDPSPRWQLGHTSYLTYHDFDLSVTLRAYLGNYVYDNVASANGAYQDLQGSGMPSNLQSSVLTTGFIVPQYYSDYYVEKASFLRMDAVTLGYTFRVRGQALRCYATVQNAFTITGYRGVDPTPGVSGIDGTLYPRSRTVVAGVSAGF